MCLFAVHMYAGICFACMYLFLMRCMHIRYMWNILICKLKQINESIEWVSLSWEASHLSLVSVCVNLVYDQSHRLFEPLFRVKSPIFDHKFSITKLGARARAHASPLLYYRLLGRSHEGEEEENKCSSFPCKWRRKQKQIYLLVSNLFISRVEVYYVRKYVPYPRLIKVTF